MLIAQGNTGVLGGKWANSRLNPAVKTMYPTASCLLMRLPGLCICHG